MKKLTTLALLLVACHGTASHAPDASVTLHDGMIMDHDDGGNGTDEGSGTSDGSTLSTLTLSAFAGLVGGSGDLDGVGPAARFDNPAGVVFDGAGHLYVADVGNRIIRKVELATGTVTTIAGNPTATSAKDGTGTAAAFSGPSHLALQGGTLYISDEIGATIRQMVLSTGVVTTLAGSPGMEGHVDGTGTAAEFDYPRGLCSDGGGNLWVADYVSNSIRKVVIATGVVTTLTTVIGGNVIGLVCAKNNTLYAVTQRTVVKVVTSPLAQTVLAGGATTVVDGTGTAAGFESINEVWSDGSANLYVSDADSIRQIVIASGKVTTLAGSTAIGGFMDGVGAAARFTNASGLAGDASGNLYVADDGNSVIRKIALSSATVTTPIGQISGLGNVDGTGTAARFNRPDGMALDGAGNMYVADELNSEVRKVVLATGAVTTLGMVPTPFRVVFDGNKTLYVTGGKAIYQIDLDTKMVSILAGSTTAGNTDGTGTAATFNGPSGIYYDGAGKLYCIDNSTMREIDISTALVTTLAGKPGALDDVDGMGSVARFNNPAGITGDGAGNLYIADVGNSTVRKFVVATTLVSTIAGYPGVSGSADGSNATARFKQPSSVALDGTSLLITDYGNSNIRELDLTSGDVSTVLGKAGQPGVLLGPATTALLHMPLAILRDPTTHALYITDENAVLVLK